MLDAYSQYKVVIKPAPTMHTPREKSLPKYLGKAGVQMLNCEKEHNLFAVGSFIHQSIVLFTGG